MITSRTFKNPKKDIVVIPTEQRCEYRWATGDYSYKKPKKTDITQGIVPDGFGWSRGLKRQQKGGRLPAI